MRHGVILIAQNEIENFCEDLFRKMNMDFEERATAINMVQCSMYRQLVTKYSYDNNLLTGITTADNISTQNFYNNNYLLNHLLVLSKMCTQS